jgi:hypothetical protein
VDATIHLARYERVNPYVSLGAGWRMLAMDNPGTHENVFLHGFRIVRVNLGVDVPVSRDVAIGPFAGADATWFMTQIREGRGNVDVLDRGVTTMFVAGLQGRFDFGGTRETHPPSDASLLAKR